jgi:uncharacterized membrane protein YdjX (TVP38/TMEM64 family)
MRRRLVLVALLLIALLSLAIYFTPFREIFTTERATEFLQEARHQWWAPLVYIGLYVVLTLLLIPPFFLSAAAAIIWGWFGGGVVELVAATLAAIPPYALARYGGGEWLRGKLQNHRGMIYYDRVRGEGFLAVLIFRLVPVIPYILLNYLAGLASIRPLNYLIATFLGMIPSIFIFTYFVDAIAVGTSDWREAAPRIFLAGASIAVLILLTRYAARRLR